MRNRDIFASNINPIADKELLGYTKKLKQIIREYHLSLVQCSPITIESQNPQLCWAALTKSALAIEGAIELILCGYVGSARALFRQIYEFLLWAKIARDAPDETILTNIKSHFILKQNEEGEIVAGYCNVMDFFKPKVKKPEYTVSIAVDRERFSDIAETDSELIKSSQKFYKVLCAYTHASSAAQQIPIPDNDFYEQWKLTLEELSGLTALFIEVFEQYFNAVVHENRKKCVESDEELNYRLSMTDSTHAAERVAIQKLLEQLNSDSEDATYFLIISFSGKWDIKRRTKNDNT